MMFSSLLFLAAVYVACVFAETGSVIQENVTAVGLEAISGDHIVVHIVAHTHDDPGWLITTDEYYVQEVQWIFYTMIPVLIDNPIRKFTYVEMAYMSRWWQEIDDKLKQDTIAMIDSGQLQINLGGWCMNDEANPTVSAVIHQMTDGNQFVLHNFGDNGRPTVAWHVDPFGHSYVTGGLWAQNGFDAFAVHRINFYDLAKRKAAQNLEFMWKGSSSLGEDAWIFFHILDDGYGSPKQIQFWNGNSWIQTDPLLPSWPPNQIPLAEGFLAQVRQRVDYFRHNQILIPFGSDFAHQNAYQSMLQMDKFIEYVNSNATYNATLIYSTLKDYIEAVNALNLTWPLETPDFFTYVDRPNAWWSGYFTSRPALKLIIRKTQNQERLSEQFYFYAKLLDYDIDFAGAMRNISKLRDAVAVSQHHDAITGTEKDFVAEQYFDQMNNDTIDTNYFIEDVAGLFFTKNGKSPSLSRYTGTLMDQLNGNNYIAMPVYNSLPWRTTQYLRIPANRSDLVVYDSAGKLIPSQIIPVMETATPFAYACKYQVFIYSSLGPLSFDTFFIGVSPGLATVSKRRKAAPGDVVGTGTYSLQFDSDSGLLSGIRNNQLGSTIYEVNNQFVQYVPSGGVYNDGMPNSGAYIFRPAQDNRLALGGQNKARSISRTVLFRETFSSAQPAPGFITTTYGSEGNYLDVFQAKVCSVDLAKNQFEFEFYRADAGGANGWGQSPSLQWAVFDSANPAHGHGVFEHTVTGSMAVPKSSAQTAVVTVSFGSAFGAVVPRFIPSVRGTVCDGSQYAYTITAVTATSATLYIRRIDRAAGWSEAVFVDWVAYDASQYVSGQRRLQGQSTISVSATAHAVLSANITLPTTDFYVWEPIVLLSIRQVSPAVTSAADVFLYTVSAYMNTNVTFQLRLSPETPMGSGNVQLAITYLVFERHALRANVTDDVTYHIEEGPLISEVQQFFRNNYAQSWRVFHSNESDLQYIDNQVHIGPIDQGAELVTRFSTELQNEQTFYTNQASLEYVRRQYYPYWDEPIAGNYYPSSGQSYMEDTSLAVRFATIVNQGHGVGGLREGEMEMMLQRRCLQDDGRGVNEVLNTTHHTEPSIYVLLDAPENVAYLSRRLYYMQEFPVNHFWALTDSITGYVSSYNTSWSAMNADYMPDGLPPNVFLMQMRYVYSGGDSDDYSTGIIMQLQNMFETGESSKYSVNVTVNLNDILDHGILTVAQGTEMTLTGNLPLTDMHRLPWNVKMEDGTVVRIRDQEAEDQRRKRQRQIDASLDVNLFPREIRTFVVNEDVSAKNRQGLAGFKHRKNQDHQKKQ